METAMAYDAYKLLHVTTKDRVVTAVIDNPPINLITLALYDELVRISKELEADDFTTVAGLIISELGHVPAVGEKLQFKGLEFEVADADNRRVNRVRLRPIEATGDNDGHDGANHGA